MNNKYGFIRRRLADLNKSQTELSETLHLQAPAINKIMTGQRGIKGEEVAPLAEFLNYNVESFANYVSGEISNPDDIIEANGPNVPDTIKIPYYNVAASAGAGIYSGQDYVQSFLRVSVGRFADRIMNAKSVSAITVCGDSMNPNLNDGDIILVDTSSKDISDGKIYIINIDDKLFVKRLFINPISKKIIIRSDNPFYPEFEADENTIAVCGRLIMRVFQDL